MKNSLTPISEIIKVFFEKIDQEKSLSQEEINALWGEIAGRAAKHSIPAAIKNGVLIVRVDSSAWMQELALQKRNLLKGLKRKLGKDRISEIQFKAVG